MWLFATPPADFEPMMTGSVVTLMVAPAVGVNVATCAASTNRRIVVPS